jgi:hypothetical protein
LLEAPPPLKDNMHLRSHAPKFAIALLACALIARVNAAPTIFLSRSAWEANTPGFTNLDFENFPGNGAFVGAFSESGVNFNPGASYGPDAYLFSYGPSSGYSIGSGNYMLGGFNLPGQYSRWTDISFPSTFNSFGLDLSTYNNNGAVSVTAVTNLGSYANLIGTPNGGSSFFGLQLGAGESLSYLRLTEGNNSADNFVFDNVSFGNAAAPVNSVPDSGSTLVLFGMAMSALVIVRRRTGDRRVTSA